MFLKQIFRTSGFGTMVQWYTVVTGQYRNNKTSGLCDNRPGQCPMHRHHHAMSQLSPLRCSDFKTRRNIRISGERKGENRRQCIVPTVTSWDCSDNIFWASVISIFLKSFWSQESKFAFKKLKFQHYFSNLKLWRYTFVCTFVFQEDPKI